jgi:hypothetical protein
LEATLLKLMKVVCVVFGVRLIRVLCDGHLHNVQHHDHVAGHHPGRAIPAGALSMSFDLVPRNADLGVVLPSYHLGKYLICTRPIGVIPGCIPAPYDPTLRDLDGKTIWRRGMTRAQMQKLLGGA